MLIIAAATIAAVVLVAAGGLYWFFSGDGMRRALEQQATAWLGQPVRIKAARGQLFPRPGIGLSGVEVGEPVQLMLSSVDLSTDLRALLNRRIEDARVLISDSTIQMPLPFAFPEQNGSSRDEAVTQSAVRVISVQEISLRDIHIRSRGREVRVTADSSLNGNHLTLSRFTADSGSTSLQVKGEAELEPRVDAKLLATANKIDIDELLAIAEAFTPERRAARRGAPSPPMKVVAQLKADTATAAGVQVTQFTTNMSLDGNRFTMSPMTFGLFGGSYDGSLTGRLGGSMSATLKSHLKGLDVAQLAAFGGSPDTITGTLSGEVRSTPKATTWRPFSPAQTGEGRRRLWMERSSA